MSDSVRLCDSCRHALDGKVFISHKHPDSFNIFKAVMRVISDKAKHAPLITQPNLKGGSDD
jgi:hypothetical protein